MIDKKKLLEEGLIEQYILGELHRSDEAYIAQIIATDKEVKTYAEEVERDFETLGLENAITPPQHIKNNLIKAIKVKNIEESTSRYNPISGFKLYYRIAASFALLLLASSIWLYSQLNQLQNDVVAIKTERTLLNSELEGLKSSVDESSELYAVLSHPDTKQLVLQGNDLMPEGKVVSFVNHDVKSVVINTERLPNLDAEHDYQMWADVDGEMINMGVIDTSQPLLAMNYIDHAESLNITIEPIGGSEHPTVERLVTNVYL